MKTKLTLLIILLSVFSVYEEGKAQVPSWAWAKSAAGTNYDGGNGISTDINGNVLVTGAFKSSSLTFGATILTNAGVGDFFIVKYDASGNVLWAKSAGGTSNDYGIGLSTDASGNVLITGGFESSSITFGTTTLTNTGTGNFFIVKYDASGNVLWAKSAGGASNNGGAGISTDASGNVLVTGDFQSVSVTFGTTTLTNAGSISTNDIFVVKYDASGNVLWAKSAGGNSTDYVRGISTDASGNVLITGSFQSDSISFGTTTLTNASAGNNDIFVAKYDVSGNVLWAKSAGGSSSDEGWGIATDVSGNVAITGHFNSSSITLGSTTLTNAGADDIFIIKYDASGNVAWAKSAGGTFYDDGFGISTDSSGNLIVTGNFQNPSITFGTTTLTNSGGADIFIVKYDASGNVLWAKSAGGTSYDGAFGSSSDANGNILVTGYFQSPSITFGTTTLTNTGLYDIFIAKLYSTVSAAIEEQNSNNGVSIYPNPSTGQISITSSKDIDEVTITNPLGQVVYQAKPKDKNLSIKIKDDGIYFVTITSDKKTSTQKIIVQH
ncbi:MAG: T9SS type A sorting domain-containing protein [Bacteroidia bacterium]